LVAGDWPEASEEVVYEVPIPEALDGGWEVLFSDQVNVVPESSGAESGSESKRALALGPVGVPFLIRVPLDLPPGSFDRIRMRFSSPGFTRVAGLVGRGTQRRLIGDFVERYALTEAVDLNLDMIKVLGDDRPLKELHLVFEAMTDPGLIEGIELIRRSASLRMPSPLKAPKDVSVGSGSRRSVGLLPGMRLAADIPNGLKGLVAIEASLLPSMLASKLGNVTLELFGNGQSLQRKTFDLQSGWSTCALTLPDQSDRSLVVTTELPVGVLAGTARVLAPPKPHPRTVLLITSDTHRSDHMGYAQDGMGVVTPTLDALAQGGVRFDDAVSVTSITNPSHASIFTGLHARDHGIVGNLAMLSERADTIAEEFQRAGYRTFASVSARHLMPWRSGFGQGYERFDAPETSMLRDGAITVAKAEEFLQDAKGHDVFLWLHLFDAHAPYIPHEGCSEQYYSGDPYSKDLPPLPPEAVPSWDPEVRDLAFVRSLYKGEITYLDRLLQGFFETHPRVLQGAVAFTADHGESLGEHDMYWGHAGLYSTTLKVPLILHGPGLPAGTIVQTPVQNDHIAHTLMQMAGLPASQVANFPGVSLLDAVGPQAKAAAPRFVLGANALSAGVFFEDWYLLLHIRANTWGNPPPLAAHTVELYNLKSDRLCANNVVADHPDVVKRLRPALVKWLNDPSVGGPLTGAETASEEARSDVSALGYAADEFSRVDGPVIDPACPCAECARYR